MIIWILNGVVDRSDFGNKALEEDEEGWKPHEWRWALRSGCLLYHLGIHRDMGEAPSVGAVGTGFMDGGTRESGVLAWQRAPKTNSTLILTDGRGG